jgi:hypothetical protein
MTATTTLELMLRAASPSSVGALEALLERQIAHLARASEGTRVRCAFNIANHLALAAANGADLTGCEEVLANGLPPNESPVDASSFDAVLEIGLPPGADAALLIDTAASIAGELGSSIDPARSTAVVGVEHQIIRGTGEIQLYYCLRRIPRLTHAEFSDYWLNSFTRHSRHTPGKAGYHQLHADEALTIEANAAAGFAIDDVDGVALEWFPDFPAFSLAIDHGREKTEAGAAFMGGERQMNDFARAMSMISYVPSVPSKGAR